MKLKRISLLLITILVSSVGLTSCNDDRITIGILKHSTHQALNATEKGFKDFLSENGYGKDRVRYIVQNPEGQTSTEASMARNLVFSSDLLYGIATPAASALKVALEDYSLTTPTLFTAVTDPISANLVKSFTEHDHITGTSDAGPTKNNIELFKEFNIDKIAVLWNTSEPNSLIQRNEAKEACDKLEMTYVDGGVSQSNQISTKLQSFLAQNVKGIFIPTDNLIDNSISSIKEFAIENKIIVICADNLVTMKGGSLGYSLDYEILGRNTGEMAYQILEGKDPKDIPVSKAKTFPLTINKSFFDETGIEIPESLRKEMN